MMTSEIKTDKGFFYQPDEAIEKSDRYIFHKDDGEKVSDKIITCDDLLCWCQEEFSVLAADAESELLNGHKVVTDQGVFSLDAAESFELQESDS